MNKIRPAGRQAWVSPDSEICIEGFPRSANTFVFAAIRMWNPRAVIAHGRHTPGQLRLAVRHQIPSALLIREPEDAVASLLVYYRGKLSPRRALAAYISFHRPLVPIAGDLVVCPFEVAITDPGLIVNELNDRFNTSFASGTLDERERRELLDTINGWRTHQLRDPALASVPDSARSASRAEALSKVGEQPSLSTAQELYRSLIDAAGARVDRERSRR